MIQNRTDTLLGSCAVHCDSQDCHMEHVCVDEATMRAQAIGAGWTIDANGGAACPDCVTGNNPAQVLNQDPNQPMPDPPVAPPVNANGPDGHYADEDDDEPVDIDDLFERVDVTVKNSQPEAPTMKALPPGKPYKFRNTGDTVDGVTQKAEDVETAEDKDKRLKREKRTRERQESARNATAQKTREAMGGVADMLKDFDGSFGSNNTWDGD